MDIATLVGVSISAFATACAAWAAFESRRSATGARIAAEGHLVLELLKEYYDPEMSNSIRTLNKWSRSRGERFAEAWADAMEAGDPEALTVNASRRKVKGYFSKAVRLLNGGLVSEPAFKQMVYASGLNVYYDVVCPLEDIQNPRRRRVTEQTLKKVAGRYEAGVVGRQWGTSSSTPTVPQPVITDGDSRAAV